MKKIFLTIIFILLSVLFFSSCATVINNPTVDINIFSNSDSVEVYINNDSLNTRTLPVRATVKRSEQSLFITAKKDTIQKRIKVESKFSPSFLYGNLLTYGLGYIVDITNSKRFTYPKTVNINLDNDEIDLQTDKNKIFSFIFRPSFCYTVSLNSVPKTGHITDYLTNLTSNNRYNFQFSGAIFGKNWGVELSFLSEPTLPKFHTNRKKQFVSTVEEKFSDDYFVETSGSIIWSNNTDFKSAWGPAYIYEKDNFIIIGRALIGWHTFSTDWANSELKGKGTNERINIDYKTDNILNSQNAFCFNPSITVGYRLGKNLALGFDINYWLTNIDFEYKEIIENAFPHSIQTQTYKYSKLLNEMSFGLGLILFFNKDFSKKI